MWRTDLPFQKKIPLRKLLKEPKKKKLKGRGRKPKPPFVPEFGPSTEESSEGEDVKEIPEKDKPKLQIITRKQWAAEEPKISPSVRIRTFRKLPVLVRVCSTGTDTCERLSDCLVAMRNLQKRDFQEEIPDIKYNFVFSSDGLVFEGRSWQTIPHIYGQRYRSTCLLLGIFGEFFDIMPPKAALRSIGKLLTDGVKDKFVDPNFKILPFQSYRKPEKEKPIKPEISFSEFDDLVSEYEHFDYPNKYAGYGKDFVRELLIDQQLY